MKLIKKIYKISGIIGIVVAIFLFIADGGVLTLTQFLISITSGVIFGIGIS